MISSGHSYIHQTLTGTRKKENKDNYLIIEKETYLLLAIFEGADGAFNSHKANLLAMTFIESRHADFLSNEVRLDKLLYECNRYILDRNVPQSDTGCGIALISNTALQASYFCCVGSPRIYAVINRRIRELTNGTAPGSAALRSKWLGKTALTENDFIQNRLTESTNTLLLCTGGFYNFLEKAPLEFFKILNKKNLKTIRGELLLSIENKNSQDATYILIK